MRPRWPSHPADVMVDLMRRYGFEPDPEFEAEARSICNEEVVMGCPHCTHCRSEVPKEVSFPVSVSEVWAFGEVYRNGRKVETDIISVDVEYHAQMQAVEEPRPKALVVKLGIR